MRPAQNRVIPAKRAARMRAGISVRTLPSETRHDEIPALRSLRSLGRDDTRKDLGKPR